MRAERYEVRGEGASAAIDLHDVSVDAAMRDMALAQSPAAGPNRRARLLRSAAAALGRAEQELARARAHLERKATEAERGG